MRLDVRAAATENPAPLPLPVWDDGQLVQRLAAGENDALPLIYDRYAASLYWVLNAILNSPADAEDALQETFVALATGRAGKIRDLKSYLLVAARHQAFTILRRRKREGDFEDVAELEIAAPEAVSTPHDFAHLLARLPLEQREVIALKVWEELTFAEIAQVVRASPNTVMSRYRYGIERLRKWCGEENRD
ncbi:MAG: RNA polymerase sigma factor [Armatimonadetes bacterium]|nr:RNA polymerase sigma factor [Armatimonadota bacterium]